MSSSRNHYDNSLNQSGIGENLGQSSGGAPQLTNKKNQNYKNIAEQHSTPPPAIKQANHHNKLPDSIRDQINNNQSPKGNQYPSNANKLNLSNNPSGSNIPQSNVNQLPRPNMKNKE